MKILSTLLLIPFAAAAQAATPSATVPQGGVARWGGLPAKECAMYGKKYLAVDAACYYPVDIRAKLGRHPISLVDQDGKKHSGALVVVSSEPAEVPIELPAKQSRFIEVSAEDKARSAKESAEVAKVLKGSDEPARFSLPLGKPAKKMPEAAVDFGATRVFNGKHKSVHSGRDYPVGKGTPVRAVADGKVVLAADHFYSGKALYLDHGNGLVSMVFHLQSIAVKEGAEVKRGQTLGKVGETGRTTGPHIHLGLRWLGKRVDPALLMEPTSKLPSVEAGGEDAPANVEESGEPPMDDEG